MHIHQGQLKDFILDSGILSRRALSLAEEEARTSGLPLTEVLLNSGDLSEDDVRQAHAFVLGIPFVILEKKRIDPRVLAHIPEPVSRMHNIVAYNHHHNTLEVAMLDTEALSAISFLRKSSPYKIVPRLTNTPSIKEALKQYQLRLKDEFGSNIQNHASLLKDIALGEMHTHAEGVPTTRLVDSLLQHALSQGVSDIHIEPTGEHTRVRYRIGGVLYDAMMLPAYSSSAIIARMKKLSGLSPMPISTPQDGRFKMESRGQCVSFRVSTVPTSFGEKAVLRVLRESISGFTLEGLGVSGVSLERLHRVLRKQTGMIAVTGPEGSGKTTTLYTLLDILNTPDVNIGTVEDPIEFQLPRVSQTQIHPEVGFSFISGLRALTRQDTDIIMVGDLPNEETASLSLAVASVEHLVLAGITEHSASEALSQLITYSTDDTLALTSIQAVVSGRVVRTLHETRKSYYLSDSEIKELEKEANLELVLTALKEEGVVEEDIEWKDIPFYKAHPSLECKDGYDGHIGIFEVLTLSDALREKVLKGAKPNEIREHARKEGMMTMLEDGIFKSVQGRTTLEEVRNAVSKKD